MTRQALNRAFLDRQMLLQRKAIPPLRAIEQLIGLQAQQARPPFIGLWTRLEGFKREGLIALILNRKVVRVTMMRATLHLMSAKDYLQFRRSMQPALSAAMQSIVRSRTAGADIEGVIAAAEGCFAARAQTFGELREDLSRRFPEVDERVMGYIARTRLPLVMVPEEAEYGFGTEAKFAEAGSWLKKKVSDGEHVEALVLRYLAAFGPATVVDAQAWSGMPKLKPVFEALRPKLEVFRDEGKRELFDIPEASRPPEDTPAPVRFLPGFDNAILGHLDRTRIIADEHRPIVATKNLQILPTFLVDGFVAGTWEISLSKKTAALKMSPFKTPTNGVKQNLTAEGELLCKFLAPESPRFEVSFQASA